MTFVVRIKIWCVYQFRHSAIFRDSWIRTNTLRGPLPCVWPIPPCLDDVFEFAPRLRINTNPTDNTTNLISVQWTLWRRVCRLIRFFSLRESIKPCEWRSYRGSNPNSPQWQCGVLTSYTIRPCLLTLFFTFQIFIRKFIGERLCCVINFKSMQLRIIIYKLLIYWAGCLWWLFLFGECY